VELYETVNYGTQVINDEFVGKKILDFDCGEDVALILVETNEVYWSGARLQY